MTADPPTVLMVSPVVPALTGNGLAMRAGMTLRALAHHYRVRLLVVERYRSIIGELSEDLQACCDLVVKLREGRDLSARLGEAGRELGSGVNTVHYFRISTAKHRAALAIEGARLHLDLDDIESVCRPGVANLMRQRGRIAEAQFEDRMAEAALAQEIDALLTFDRVYVASRLDLERLPLCGTSDVRVLPNVVDVTDCNTEHLVRESSPFTFLLAGTLTYFPNEDGVNWFVDEVLPLLRSRADMPFRVVLTGLAPPSVKELRAVPEIDVTGWVPDIASVYRSADAEIIPLRAGGGTRIKLLEAGVFGLPVVSTTIGAEGIMVTSGEHCLIADSPDAFVQACLDLMRKPGTRRQLAENACQFVQREHSLTAMIDSLRP